MKVAFILYDGFSRQDFGRLYRPLAALQQSDPSLDLTWELCALSPLVRDDQGQIVYPSRVGQLLSEYEAVILPGGILPAEANRLSEWLHSIGPKALLAAVGRGAALLASSGRLQGRRVAADPSQTPGLAESGALPQAEALVLEDDLLTAAGSHAALELGLALCARLAGEPAAQKVRQQLQVEAASAPETGARRAHLSRQTGETQIELLLDLDGTGKHQIHTGLPFLDHMLTQIAVHGLMDLTLQAKGDLEIDPHHTVEDVALALGQAFRQALGSRRGLVRMASAVCPMDESLAWAAVDFSGRPYAVIQAEWHAPEVGGIPASLYGHFLESFASEARCNLHVQLLYGRDDHHQAEAIFKALGRALDAASRLDPRRGGSVPSSKGILF